MNDGRSKTVEDFLEAMILRYSGKEIPEGLTPEKRRGVINSILNDPDVRHRFVFSRWPRPEAVPNWKEMDPPPYNIIKPENSLPGKMAPNGVQLWGSTLMDFYAVERIPGLANLRTISTGSKLLTWCKANGEAVAKQCIEWAEDEKDPELVPVYNVANLIRSLEDLAFADESAEVMEQEQSTDTAERPSVHAKEPFMLHQPVGHQNQLFVSLTKCYHPSGLQNPYLIQLPTQDHGLTQFLSAAVDPGVSTHSPSWRSTSLSQGFRRSSSSMTLGISWPQMAAPAHTTSPGMNRFKKIRAKYIHTSSGCQITQLIRRDERMMKKTLFGGKWIVSGSWTSFLQIRTRLHRALLAWRSGNPTVARSMCQPNL